MNWSNLQPPTGDGKLQVLLNEANKILIDKSRPIPNVERVQEFVEKITSQRSGCKESREILFLNPVSTSIAPGYYETIKMPMCIMYIRLRLQANYELRQEIQISDTPQPNKDILRYLDPNSYGSLNEQREQLIMDRYPSSKKASKYYNELERKPKPYENIDEVLLDFFVIACNCMFYNQRDQELQQAGKLLINDAIDLLRRMDVNIPSWIVENADISAAQSAQETIRNIVLSKKKA